MKRVNPELWGGRTCGVGRELGQDDLEEDGAHAAQQRLAARARHVPAALVQHADAVPVRPVVSALGLRGDVTSSGFHIGDARSSF